ncbi:MAG: energy-coupling factor transporter transmembrane component T [Acidobacteriota bacterium]
MSPRRPSQRWHHGALIAWLIAALMPAALTGNPLYLAIDLALLGWVYTQLGRGSEIAAAWGGLARLGFAFALFTLIINVFFGGAGDTVLLTLPSWRPGGGPLQLGGPVTLEGLLFGVVSTLALLCAILALATFNILVDHYQLTRAVPAALHQSATIVSIALAFLPQLASAQREIRQAHALRGHRIRGVRDLAPLLVALLGEAMERAIRLAESMEARGYSAATSRTADRRGLATRLAIVGGLGSILAGAVLRGMGNAMPIAVDPRMLGTLAGLAGLALLIGAFWHLGRQTRRSRHRRARWRRRDTVLTAISLTTAVGLMGIWATRRSWLFFQPWPTAEWPPFEPWIPLLFVPVLVPWWVARSARPAIVAEGTP